MTVWYYLLPAAALQYMSKELKAYRKSYVFRKGDVVRYVGPSRGSSRAGAGGPGLGKLADASWLLSSYSSRYSVKGTAMRVHVTAFWPKAALLCYCECRLIF